MTVSTYVVTAHGRELGAFHTQAAAKRHALTVDAKRVEHWRGKHLVEVFHWDANYGGWAIYQFAQD